MLNFAAGTLPQGAASIHFYGGTLQWAAGNTQDVSAGIAPIAAGQTVILDTAGNNVNFATGLSGSGGLAKVGGGVLALLAANAYTGPTTVSAGTLQLGNGVAGSDGSIAGGAIVNNAAIVYDLSGNQAYAGAISGSGSLTLAGEASLVLSGSDTYEGGTIVDAGTLVVAASAALPSGSSLTVGAGGVLVFDPSAIAAPLAAASSESQAANVEAVPEPSTFALLAVAGLVAAVAWRKMRVWDFSA